jgi:hypothetical protein
MNDEGMLVGRKEGKKEGKKNNLTRSWHKCHLYTDLIHCGLKRQFSKTYRNKLEINEDNQDMTLFF